ncbi:MAG: DJ-1/PfpI family protein [Chloroflexi bacterium]|nr:DJ-1/PfpI family protein [Chloroflexota bacterium]
MGRPPLEGMRIAALVGEAFELKELTELKEALEQAGAQVIVVGPEPGRISGVNVQARGDDRVGTVTVDVPLDRARPEEYDALLLPGGAEHPDPLYTDPLAVEFVRRIDDAGCPVAVAGYGPILLAAANVVGGRIVCGAPAVRDYVEGTGGIWSSQPILVSQNWICSRSVGELPNFVHTVIQEFGSYWRRFEQRAA